MELSTVQQILLSILAAALALFLILSIAIAVMVIRLLKTLRTVAEKAERVVESAEAVGDVFKKAAGPLGIFRLIQGIIDHSRKDK
jgi:hypothetical protein